jgi:AraC family transcriptional regulator, arabinose operon regulatory protein
MTAYRTFNMDPRVLKVVDYIEANPHLHLQLDRLAKTMNMSSSRLRHIFTAQVGVSPKQYLRTIRMELAKHLVENTYLNVKEVMTKVGFNDESHFVRDFEKAFGLTPSRHRQKHRSMNLAPPNMSQRAPAPRSEV